MSSGQPGKPNDLDQVYVEAYRNYLRSLRDGLANIDIDALDLSHVRAPAPPGTALFTIGTPPPGTALFTIGTPPAGAALFTIGPAASGRADTGGGTAGDPGSAPQTPDETTS